MTIGILILLYATVTVFVFIRSAYMYYTAMRETPFLDFTTGDLIVIIWVSILWLPFGLLSMFTSVKTASNWLIYISKDFKKVLIASSKQLQEDQ